MVVKTGADAGTVRRGEIHWLEVEDLGRRPVLVLTSSELIDSLRQVVVAGLTTTVRNVVTEVPVGPDLGVTKPSAVNLLDVRTVPRALLVERMTELDESTMATVCGALGFSTGCSW